MNFKINILKIVALCLLCMAIVSQIDAGIVKLVPYGGRTSTYVLQNKMNYSLIISLSTFTSVQTNTSCSTISLGSTVNISCTSNIQSFSYLFYKDNIMIYSNHYTMYFFDRNDKEEVNLPIELSHKYISKPLIRAFIQGYEQINKLQSYIDISQYNISSSLIIKRSLNIRKLRFIYLVIQNSPFYNLTFQTRTLTSGNRMAINSKFILNFIGVSKISFTRQSFDSPISLQIIYSNLSNTTTSTTSTASDSFANMLSLSINKIIISPKTQISIILISLLSSTSCYSPQSFNPLSNSCSKICQQNNLLRFSFMQRYITFCINRNLSTSNASVALDNYATIQRFNPFGCEIPTSLQYSIVVCKKCLQSFVNLNSKCICGYNYYEKDSKCFVCNNNSEQNDKNCNLRVQTELKILQGINLNTISVQILYSIPKINQVIFQWDYLIMNVTINAKKYLSKASYDKHSKSINILVQNVAIAAQYLVQIVKQPQYTNYSNFLYVADDYGSYLWAPVLQETTVDHPISNKQIVQSIAPIFTHSQTSVPIITTISFAVGQKINLLGIFQTVSILYLINFINLNQNIKDLALFIKEMFIFQPVPLIKIFGKDGYVKVNVIDNNMTKINQQVFAYTKGQSYIALGLDNILIYSFQTLLLFLIIKILKFIASPSRNTIVPSSSSPPSQSAQQKSNYILNINFKIKRSLVDKYNNISWLRQPQLCQQSTIRHKLYYKLYLLDQKKWIISTSLISVQIVGNSFLILQELLIPAYDISVTISQIIASLILLFILLYPLLFINYEPLYILKCASIIYKRRKYTLVQLWVLFYYYYVQCLIFSVVILVAQNGQVQTGIISLLLLIKIVVFKHYLKNIEFLKQTLIFLFFFIIFLSFYLPKGWIINVKSTLLVLILGILACEFFKLFRSIVIVFLNLFKEQQPTNNDKIVVQVVQNDDKNSKDAKDTKNEVLKVQ